MPTTIIRTRDNDGDVTLCPKGMPPVMTGYTVRKDVTIPSKPAGDTTSKLRWDDATKTVVWYAVPLTPQQTFDAAVAAGYTVPGVTPPLVLDLGDGARATFTGLMVLINSLMSSGQLLATSTQTITGDDGTPRALPVSQIETILVGYGLYYANLFNALHAETVAAS